MAKRGAHFIPLLLLICALILSSFVLSFDTKNNEKPRCEPMNVEQCRTFGYNVTGIPNIFGDASQGAVERRLLAINELLTSKCAKPIRFFLCSMYAPMCSRETGTLIMSCRDLCEFVTRRCKTTAVKFGIAWLDAWNCTQFYSENNDDQMCMRGPGFNYTIYNPLHSTTTHNAGDHEMPFVNGRNYILVDKRSNSWALLCDRDGIFTSEMKDFADRWMTVWSIVCFASTSVAALLFFVDTQRLRYPEQAIMILCLCYNFFSVGYILRIIFGRNAVSCASNNDSQSYIIRNQLDNPLCAFVFLFLYFFGMAANIWWVILTLTWFLAAGMKWGYEAIHCYTNLFHLVAWLLPVIKTVLVLIFHKIDGDELTGLCYVGNQDLLALAGFVLGPQFTYLIIGTLFLLVGFITLYRIRMALHKERVHKIDKLGRFIVRIGFFSLLTTVPAACFIATQFYEYTYREDWQYGRAKPNINMFMLKISMPLFVGIISGAWIWTSKATRAWRHFYVKRFKKQTVVGRNDSKNNVACRHQASRALKLDSEV